MGLKNTGVIHSPGSRFADIISMESQGVTFPYLFNLLHNYPFGMNPVRIFLTLCVLSFLLPVSAQERLPTSREIPILAWGGVPERENTLERFKEIRDAGFTINYANFQSLEGVEKALGFAQQVGMKIVVRCPELRTDTENTVRRLMKHPALAGYFLQDEPGADDFPVLAEWAKKIIAVDNKHFCYINLFPNYALPEQLLGKNADVKGIKDAYPQYLESFLIQVPMTFLSFDNYPVVEGKSGRVIRDNWYKNLEQAMEAAGKRQIPLWAFALSVAHDPYPIPTIAEIKLQMFTNLAYGAQALQYFTYWNPRVNPNWDFHDAPIGHDGKRTVVYDRVKQVNSDLQKLAGVFMDSKVVFVKHTGKHIPAGTKRLDKLPDPVTILETDESGALVSLLEKGNRQFLVIVNRDFKNPLQLVFAAQDKVSRVLPDGTLVKASAYTSKLEIDPGDALIYTWEK